MKNKYPFLVGLALLAFSANSNSQIMYSNGATIAITTGAVVWSNGGVTLDNTTNLTNAGSLTVKKNSIFPLDGTFTINNSSASQGDGTYQVEQDWINNATFVANNSTVRLFGNTQQFITSVNNTVTTFHNLTLLGNGANANRKKSLLLVNAISDPTGNDSLNDRELETQTNIFYVQNRNTNAVQNNQTFGSEGFVSSMNPGTFSRETQAGGGAYFFPVGSSANNLTRYRPAMLTNTGAASNDEYHARFINWDADVDNFIRAQNDGLECLSNDTFYHAIDRAVGNDPADIAIYYLPANDGTWDGMAHWRNASTNWNDMATVSQAPVGSYTVMTRTAWAFATAGFPYLLTQLTPAAPTIACPTFCENTFANLFTATGGGPGSTYTWTVPGNGNINSGQGTDSLYVDWTTGTSNVTVTYQDPGGCMSQPVSCSPTVNPNPTAAIVTDTTGGGPWATNWNFLGNNGPTSWAWDFGDGHSSTSQNATNNYDGAGTYTVTLTVTNNFGCIDTAQMVVSVNEGVLIPNVFSPNGDGSNDEFYIPSSGFGDYHIEIYDRWGVKVFDQTSAAIHWDGRSTSGLPCTDGTYYYILHYALRIDPSVHDVTGFLTLIGSVKQ